MWKGFRWKSPESRKESGRPRRVRDVLHRLFDPLRRAGIGTTFLDQKRSSGLKYQKLATHLMNEYGSLDAKAQSLVDQENSSTPMVSDLTYTEALELQMKEYEKQRMLPISAQVMRTISIHHLDCNIYVKSDAKITDLIDDRAVLSTQDGDSFPITANQIHAEGFRHINDNHSKHLSFEELSSLFSEQQELFEEKLKETRISLQKHQNADPAGLEGDVSLNEEKQFLDALELFHKNREKFLKVLQDPHYLSINYLRDIKKSGVSPVLSKSVSCPRACFPAGGTSIPSNKGENNNYCDNENGKSQSDIVPSISETDTAAADKENLPRMNQIDPNIAAPNYIAHETRNPSAFRRFQDIKRRIKDLIKDEDIESHWITLDGILDKIPADHTAEVEGSVAGRFRRKNSFGSDWTASAANSRFRRSRSLSDSLDRYSHFLDNDIYRGFQRHASNRFNWINEGGASQTTANASKAFGRIHSLPEYNSYYPVELAPTTSHAISLSEVTSLDSDQAGMLIDSRASIYQDPPGISPSPQNEDLITVAKAEFVAENSVNDATSDLVQTFSMDGVCNKISDVCHSISDKKDTNNHFNDHKVESDSAKMKQSSASETIPDRIQIDTLSFPLLEAENVETGDSLEILTDDTPHDDSRVDIKKLISSPFPAEFDLDALRIDMQGKDMSECNYVMDIMKRSGFRNSELQGRWHSPELPLDPALFKELEGISPDTEICSCVVDLNLDHLLLFDLTNEILLEIYETCSVQQLCCPSSSRVCWRHEGQFFLKDVWDKIRPYFSSPPRVDPKTDVLEQDFDRHLWLMEMRHDVEGIHTKLEEMILDDMVDDAVNQLVSLAALQCAVC